MDKIKELLSAHWLGILGAFISLRFIAPQNWIHALLSVVGGTAAAVGVAPLVVETFGAHMSGAASFLVGLFSMTIFGIVFDIIDRFRKSPVRSVRSITNIIIDVFLAARHGTTRQERNKSNEN